MVSLSMGMLINVKITDYGISQESTFLGLAAQKGTSGYQAPEIAKGDGEYHTEVCLDTNLRQTIVLVCFNRRILLYFSGRYFLARNYLISSRSRRSYAVWREIVSK